MKTLQLFSIRITSYTCTVYNIIMSDSTQCVYMIMRALPVSILEQCMYVCLSACTHLCVLLWDGSVMHA